MTILFPLVTVPALTIGLDMTHYGALGTSLAAMVPTAIVGSYAHHKQGEKKDGRLERERAKGGLGSIV